jgi:hypothetical protein
MKSDQGGALVKQVRNSGSSSGGSSSIMATFRLRSKSAFDKGYLHQQQNKHQ